MLITKHRHGNAGCSHSDLRSKFFIYIAHDTNIHSQCFFLAYSKLNASEYTLLTVYIATQLHIFTFPTKANVLEKETILSVSNFSTFITPKSFALNFYSLYIVKSNT